MKDNLSYIKGQNKKKTYLFRAIPHTGTKYLEIEASHCHLVPVLDNEAFWFFYCNDDETPVAIISTSGYKAVICLGELPTEEEGENND